MVAEKGEGRTEVVGAGYTGRWGEWAPAGRRSGGLYSDACPWCSAGDLSWWSVCRGVAGKWDRPAGQGVAGNRSKLLASPGLVPYMQPNAAVESVLVIGHACIPIQAWMNKWERLSFKTTWGLCTTDCTAGNSQGSRWRTEVQPVPLFASIRCKCPCSFRRAPTGKRSQQSHPTENQHQTVASNYMA